MDSIKQITFNRYPPVIISMQKREQFWYVQQMSRICNLYEVQPTNKTIMQQIGKKNKKSLVFKFPRVKGFYINATLIKCLIWTQLWLVVNTGFARWSQISETGWRFLLCFLCHPLHYFPLLILKSILLYGRDPDLYLAAPCIRFDYNAYYWRQNHRTRCIMA